MHAAPPDHPQNVLPGCGLAAYVVLLLTIASAGAIGVAISSYSLVAGGSALSPMRTSYGGVVDSRVLQPMREAGLLLIDEIPDAFHAESYDGSAACAISGDKLLRLSSDAGAQSVLLLDLVRVEGGETEVVAETATVTIRCPFRTGEGAGSFKAMLKSVR